MGDPLTIAELNEHVPGQVVKAVLGNDLLGGQTISHVVKRNTWYMQDIWWKAVPVGGV